MKKEFTTLKKNEEGDIISWCSIKGQIGSTYYTFDGKKMYRLFGDYPDNLTPEEKKIFDRENPFWKEFFEE